MFGISYNTWEQICKMYFSMRSKSKESFLQWFPFSKLTKREETIIRSKKFFDKYIKTGAFVLSHSLMHSSDNYIQKGDGSFRDSSLVSPVLYLVLQAVGKEIFECYTPERSDDIEVYYAGSYKGNRPQYKLDYDVFFKSINAQIEGYQYFIKTDITNFYANINLDILIKRIDEICNVDTVKMSQAHLHLYKELLSYCGNGRFPLLENSVASSFLSTVVYLDIIDVRLKNYIKDYIKAFDGFKIIRYVDDMYILIASSESREKIHEASNIIRNEYSSILKDYGLSLNSTKYSFRPASEINNELKKSIYSEMFYGERSEIGELFQGEFVEFLRDIAVTMKTEYIDIKHYNRLIEKHFSKPDIIFTPGEIFNYFVYEYDKAEGCLESTEVCKIIIDIIKRDISFISLDPKRLTVMVMKTHNEEAIKAMLNRLFERHKQNLWNSYDTSIAISYLIQRGFKHRDLINVLELRCQMLYEYYQCFCKKSFIKKFNNKNANKCREIIGDDWKAFWLYFMYVREHKRNNSLAMFAYFKNFFDRFTADFSFYLRENPKLKRPNYNGFYKEKDLQKFYERIEDSDEIIKHANDLRNSNPISHASAELIDKNSSSHDLTSSIKEMKQIIHKSINSNLYMQE